MPYSGGYQKMIQAFTLTKVDWENSYPDYFVFDEDEVTLKNVKLSSSSALVFDIKRYNFETKQAGDFGFAVLPVVTDFQNRVYVNSGVF